MAIILALSPMHLLELMLCREESHPFQILFILPTDQKDGLGGEHIYIYISTCMHVCVYIYIYIYPRVAAAQNAAGGGEREGCGGQGADHREKAEGTEQSSFCRHFMAHLESTKNMCPGIASPRIPKHIKNMFIYIKHIYWLQGTFFGVLQAHFRDRALLPLWSPSPHVQC